VYFYFFVYSIQQNGYFDLEIRGYEEKVGDLNNFFDASNIKIRRVNGTKTRGMYGPWIIHGPIDDTYIFRKSFYIKQGGEYRPLPIVIPDKGYCKSINEDEYFMPQVAEKSNLTLPIPCPLVNVNH
jgi:hypothetical protein